MKDATRSLRPECPAWCVADYQPELDNADTEGYLHRATPYLVELPGHPELAPERQRRLVFDIVAFQRPDPGPDDLRPRIEWDVEHSGDDVFSVLATRNELDAAVDALHQAADALEQRRNLLPETA